MEALCELEALGELEDEDESIEEIEETYGMREEDVQNDSNVFKVETIEIRGLCRLWLKAEPDGDRFDYAAICCVYSYSSMSHMSHMIGN